LDDKIIKAYPGQKVKENLQKIPKKVFPVYHPSGFWDCPGLNGGDKNRVFRLKNTSTGHR